MKNFLSIADAGDVQALVKKALALKNNPYADKALGQNKTLGLVFLNPSLRTRLSSQLAAANLGMNVLPVDFGRDSWSIETEIGAVMDGDKTEHIQEAAGVLGQYCDVIGIRMFPTLQDREKDYEQNFMKQVMAYAKKPVINLESACEHPLQALADMMTIEETKRKKRPKVVLSWAPHCKILPQAVPNSFSAWAQRMDVDFVITHPEGHNLPKEYVQNAKITHDQEAAFKGADYIYAKNWSSYEPYGKILCTDRAWTVDARKMALTNDAFFMHCLPVRRNLIVTDEVLNSSLSIVMQQAKNRIFAAQTVLKTLLTEGK